MDVVRSNKSCRNHWLPHLPFSPAVSYVHCNSTKQNTIIKSLQKTLENQPNKHYKTKNTTALQAKNTPQNSLKTTKQKPTLPSDRIYTRRWGAREKQLDSSPTTLRARSQVRCFLLVDVAELFLLVCFSMFFKYSFCGMLFGTISCCKVAACWLLWKRETEIPWPKQEVLGPLGLQS